MSPCDTDSLLSLAVPQPQCCRANGLLTFCWVWIQALQDRFIPTRSAMDLDVAHYSLTSTENDAPANSTAELLSPQKVRGMPCQMERPKRPVPRRPLSPLAFRLLVATCCPTPREDDHMSGHLRRSSIRSGSRRGSARTAQHASSPSRTR